MVQNEDPTHSHLLTFNALWQSAARYDSLLVYSTGRSPDLYRRLWEEAPLLTPDVLICSVGTEVFYLTPTEPTPGAGAGASAGAGDAPPPAAPPDPAAPPPLRYVPDPAWERRLDVGWQRERVLGVAARFPELKRQASSEQRRHKLSFILEPPGEAAGQVDGAGARRDPQAVLRELQDALAEEGLRVKVVYSGGRDVDLLAEGAGKGAALAFLLGRLRQAGCEPTDGVQVNGDSGNDIELFTVPGVRGCVVANAFPELKQFAAQQVGAAKAAAIKANEAGDCGGTEARECAIYQATEPCAGGIMQALCHFRSLPPACFPAADGDAGDGKAAPLSAEALAVAAAYACLAAGGEAAAACESLPAAAAAAAAAGVWLDRVEVEAGGGAAAAGSAGEWVVRCQTHKLLLSGMRDTASMSRAEFRVRPAAEAPAEAGGANDRASAAGRAPVSGAHCLQATRRTVAAIGMEGIVLPPIES